MLASEARLQDAKAKVHELVGQRDALDTELSNANQQISAEQKLRSEMVDQQAELHENNARLQLLAQQHSSKASAATEENFKLEAKLSESTAAVSALEAHIAAANQRIGSLEEQLVAKTAAWEAQRTEVAASRIMLAQQAQLKDDLVKRFEKYVCPWSVCPWSFPFLVLCSITACRCANMCLNAADHVKNRISCEQS
jgi:chromosome segregation ATPase